MKFSVSIVLLVFSSASYAVGVCKSCTLSGLQPDPRGAETYILLEGNWSESETQCSNT